MGWWEGLCAALARWVSGPDWALSGAVALQCFGNLLIFPSYVGRTRSAARTRSKPGQNHGLWAPDGCARPDAPDDRPIDGSTNRPTHQRTDQQMQIFKVGRRVRSGLMLGRGAMG